MGVTCRSCLSRVPTVCGCPANEQRVAQYRVSSDRNGLVTECMGCGATWLDGERLATYAAEAGPWTVLGWLEHMGIRAK
jgi:hypothetical protein